jgi:hypothetical protein
MDPITTALVAGAAFVLKGVASEAVKDAYKGLKDLLAGKLSSLANLEDDPADEDYRKAAGKELQKKGLADDPAVLGKASELTQAIEREPPERLAAAAIDISRIRAAGEILVRDLAARGNVTVKDLEAREGKVHVEGIRAGQPEKN